MKRDLHTELGISTNDKKTALDINAETVEKNVFANIGTRPHRSRKRLGAAVLAAAITVTFCAAAADKMWGGGIWGIFGANQKQAEKLAPNSADLNLTATDSGITVKLIQTLADNHGIYVLYEVSGFGGLKDGENLSWDKSRLKINYADSEKIPGSGGYAYTRMLDAKDGKCTMLYLRTGTGRLAPQKLTFELEGLKKFTDEGRFEPLSDAHFNFAWDFDCKNLQTVLKYNEKFNSGENTLKQIDLSPVSLWITADGKKLENCAVEVKFKDGKTISPDMNFSHNPSKAENVLSAEFDRIINVDDIELIQIDNLSLKPFK